MDIEKVEQKIAALVKRREIIDVNIKKFTVESKKLDKRIAALEVEKKRLLCGKFGELLEKKAISIEDVDLDKIVEAIDANKDVYKTKNIKTAATDEVEAAEKIAGDIEAGQAFVQAENKKINGKGGVVA